MRVAVLVFVLIGLLAGLWLGGLAIAHFARKGRPVVDEDDADLIIPASWYRLGRRDGED